MVVFKKRDSVPSARYSSVCNVLRQWRIWLIPTYRVYQLYDMVMMSLLVCMRIRLQVLKVKDIASHETKGRVYTDDLENSLGNPHLRTTVVKIP